MDGGQGWLQVRGPRRRHLCGVAVLVGVVEALTILWNAVTDHEVGGQFLGVCAVAWIVLWLRAGTVATDEGLTTRAELGTRRVRWADLESLETDHPGAWATAVVARCSDGSTVRLRGVRAGEVEEVRHVWRDAVDR